MTARGMDQERSIASPQATLAQRERVSRCVDLLLNDLHDRRGFRQEWDATDAQVQAEIRDAWVWIIANVFYRDPATLLRLIVQIIPGIDNQTPLYALANDGTLWYPKNTGRKREWVKCPDLPLREVNA